MQRLHLLRMSLSSKRSQGLAATLLLTLGACAGNGGTDSAASDATQPSTGAANSAPMAAMAGSPAINGSATTPRNRQTPATASQSTEAAETNASGTDTQAAAGGDESATSDAPAAQTPQDNGAPDQAADASGDAAETGDGASEAEPSEAEGDTSAAPANGSDGSDESAAEQTPSITTEDGVDPLDPDWSARPDQGEGDGGDVVTIGDSWMDYIGGGGGIEAGLDRAGKRYRHYSLSGTTLLSGQIPSQYATAKRSNPDIKTVIMTGGGNDIMFSGGCNTSEACEESVARIQAGLDELWTEMADDGVKDVIYINYSADAGTAPKDTRPKETEPVPICLTGRILCHNLPTTDLVMGQLVDGIHPARAANDRIAAALIKMMEERKMRR